MNDTQEFRFSLSQPWLPTLKTAATATESPDLIAAAKELMEGDTDRAFAAVALFDERPASDLGRLVPVVARFQAGKFADARRSLDAAAFPPLMDAVLRAACLHNEGRPWAAAETLLGALTPGSSASLNQRKADFIASIGGFSEPLAADPWIVAAGRYLSRSGAFESTIDSLRPCLEKLASILSENSTFSHRIATGIFSMLGLSETAAPEWQDCVFKSLVVPLLRRLVDGGRGELAQTLENIIYMGYVKTRESAEHFRASYDALVPILRDAGRQAGRHRPLLQPSVIKPHYRVAFVAPQLADIAHVHTALDFVACLHELPTRMVSGLMVGITSIDDAIREKAIRLGIPAATVVELTGGAASERNLIVRLADYFSHHQIDAAVWVSMAPFCAYSFALPLAPTQIFLALKYHSFQTPDVDDYLTTGSIGQQHRILSGRKWRAVQPTVAGLFDPALSAAAVQIRDSLGPDCVVLGCIGREEKINSPDYLDAVAEILRANPTAIFLWTGRTRDELIEQSFQAAGVASQTRHIGWVNPHLYAQVLDIFLDSFPFPCGHTVMQAMAAGKPVVFFDSFESRETGVQMYIAPLLSGHAVDDVDPRVRSIFGPAPHQRFLCASESGEYIRMANELIRNVERRAEVGAALRQFIDVGMTDRHACGATLMHHLVELIEHKAARAAAPSNL